MKEVSLKLAQKDVDDALCTVEDLEKNLDTNSLSKSEVKDKFLLLSKKVDELENILKEEGII